MVSMYYYAHTIFSKSWYTLGRRVESWNEEDFFFGPPDDEKKKAVVGTRKTEKYDIVYTAIVYGL